MPAVAIRGSGVMACCSAHLLGTAGFRVTLEETARRRLPAILIGETTQALIGDVFGRNDLFDGGAQIQRRVVAWGRHAEPIVLPHRAIMLSEEALAARLRPDGWREGTGDVDWTIFAAPPLPPPAMEHRFGTRLAAALEVELADGCDRAACFIESLASGWLFLIPCGGQSGWVLAVGGAPELLLAESLLVAKQVRVRSTGVTFPAYPRIADIVCGPGWLGGGTAALAFDPLCGDGTGHAIREAILASAVVRAAAGGVDAADLRAHYRARLLAGFQRHLEVCHQFYQQGGSGAWWEGELELIRQGIAWTTAELAGARFQFRLDGFELRAADRGSVMPARGLR